MSSAQHSQAGASKAPSKGAGGGAAAGAFMKSNVAGAAAAGNGSTGNPAAAAAVELPAAAFQPSAEHPFSAEELQCISQSIQGATYTIATAQADLPYLAMMVGAKFPEQSLGLRTTQLRARSQELAAQPITSLSAQGPHPARILTLQFDAQHDDDDWYEGCPIDVAQSAGFSQGHMVSSMHTLHVYQLVSDSIADPDQDDSSGNSRVNGIGNTATHAVWARIGTAHLSGPTGQPLTVDDCLADRHGLATLYNRPGAWTAEQVDAEQAAAEAAIQAFHEEYLLDAHGRRVQGHSLNSN